MLTKIRIGENPVYDQEIKRVRDNIAALDYQIDKAEARGIKKGRAECIDQVTDGLRKVAQTMLNKNKPIKEISEMRIIGIRNKRSRG